MDSNSQQKQTSTLCFRVCFPGLTNTIRGIWAEGKYQHALNIAESAGLNKQQSIDLINGKLKMQDDPDGRPGIDGVLVPDNWDPKSEYSEYPDANDSILAIENKQLKQRISELEEACPNAAGGNAAYVPPSVSDFIAQQTALSKRGKPDPDYKGVADNGWILPNGVMYPCENTMEHIWLASVLYPDQANAEKYMEDIGCIKLNKTKGFGPIPSSVYVFCFKKPNNKQLDMLDK